MNTPPVMRLAHEIAAQFGHRPLPAAAEEIAHHIRMFWDPRMRAQLMDQVGQAGTHCDPKIAAAADLLRDAEG